MRAVRSTYVSTRGCNDAQKKRGVAPHMPQAADYLVDFLGSITGTTNVTAGAIVNTYRTQPYGAKLSGGTIGLGFFWTGNTGYRSTGRKPSERYIRAWHFSSVVGRCSTREILWSAEAICGCVLAYPVAWVYCSSLNGRIPSCANSN